MDVIFDIKIAHQIARHSAEKMSFAKILMLIQLMMSVFVDVSSMWQNMAIHLLLDLPFSRKW
jgi:hypothetical protein